MTTHTHNAAHEEGSILIEFALFCSFFVILLAGIVDYSVFIHHEIELTDAADAGAQGGTYPFEQQDTSGMQQAATSSTTDIRGESTTASYFYTCTPGGAKVASSTICNGTLDYHPLMYVQVLTTAAVPAVLKWKGLTSNLALQGQAIYRVPWMP